MDEKSPLNEALGRLASDPRVEKLFDALEADSQLHIVGGSLRNALLNRPVGDIDLATVLLPDEVTRRLHAKNIRTFPTGLKHQTVTALPIEGEEALEITTFRGPDMNPQGGVVSSLSIEEDLRYRDFTINALAYDLSSGKLIDPLQGQAALQNQILLACGMAEERFREDPLRMLRMVRFACNFNLQIDIATFNAAKALAPLLSGVSIERIREEFVKTLTSPQPARGLRMLSELNLLKLFAPEIECMKGVEQNEFHYADVFDHTLEVVEKTEPDEVLRLSALLHDVGKPSTLSIDPESGFRHFYHHESIGAEMTREFMRRLRFPNKTIEDVAILVQTHMRPLEVGPGGMRRLLRDTGDLFEPWKKLKMADSSSVKIPMDELLQRFAEFEHLLGEVLKGPPVSPLKSLAINGTDLLALGFPESRLIGEILKALHEQVLDNPELNTREELLRRAEAFRNPQ